MIRSLIIKQASAFIVRAPLVSPFRVATGQHMELENVFLQIKLANGVEGFGEAAVATHVTGETVPQTLSNLHKATEQIIGEDISNYTVFLFEFRPLFKGNHAALAALEMAVLDAYTRSHQMPLWRLFGEKAVDFSTDITVVLGTSAEAETTVRAYARRGFKAFKVKVRGNRDEDIERVVAVSKLAPDAAIIIDGNQSFSDREALKFLRTIAGRGITPALFEQPVPKDDIDGLVKLVRDSGCLICADESAGSLTDVMRLIREGAAGAINVKFMKTGILEAMEIAHIAQIKGLRLMIGAMMESALSITAAAHFAAGMDCFDFVDLDTTFFVKGPLSRSPCLDQHGHFNVTKVRRGIGVTVKEAHR